MSRRSVGAVGDKATQAQPVPGAFAEPVEADEGRVLIHFGGGVEAVARIHAVVGWRIAYQPIRRCRILLCARRVSIAIAGLF